MIPPKYYLFEGQNLTSTQVHEMLPAYSVSWIRQALMDGCKSRADLVARDAAKKAPKPRNWQSERNRHHTKFIIEDQHFPNTASVFNIAKLHGFNGSLNTLGKRLAHGENTWAKLARPVNAGKAKSIRNTQKKSHEAVHAVCETLDQRKKEMP